MPDRVLLVLGTAAGGVGVHVQSLEQGLVARGWDVTVAAPASTQQVFGFRRWEPVDVPAGLDVAAAARARRRLAALAASADVVHAHGLRAGALAAGRPLVVTWHNAQLGGGRAGSALERWTARRADVTLAASEDLARTARARGARDVRPGPVAAPVLPPPSGRDPLPDAVGPVVLAVGRLHPQKGYDVLVEAASSWPEATVAVAGDGPLRAELEARAPGVGWLGRRDDVADLYSRADVVVLPSVWEARSLTAQEAMAAGRPLVCTAVGGLPELVRDGAVVVPPGDAAALASAVRRLLDDPASAAALATRARAVAATWPDEGEVVDRVEAVYRELLG